MSYLVQLRSFVEVYRAGSISKAAIRLGISQPAMSSHIHSLEAFTRCTLFTRRSHGVVATVDGEELARLVAFDIDTIELKLSTLRSRTRKSSGTVSFIGPAELMWAKFPYLVTTLFNENIKFQLLTGNRKRIYNSLLDGSSQLGFTTSVPDKQKFGYAEIGMEKLIVVVSSRIAKNIKDNDDVVGSLATLPLIAYDDQLPLIREVFHDSSQFLAFIRPSITVPDLRILERMIRESIGWTVMPEYLCAQSIAEGQIVEVRIHERLPVNSIYLVWVESSLRNPLVLGIRNRILDLSKNGEFIVREK
ncbi:LysR family transcriptional regulator [Brenneria roseae subsp. roseae]|uniref:LysR family transcriptional regulator n=1 Tax=Brenneria roseae TaxID=1509241 RepID=UPI000D615148|nr:LysR family transcriptional regulator [Brenneria roseae]PWC18417.1 LysR family transcriptional regulator [Brenneria roseae subsp. roseae]